MDESGQRPDSNESSPQRQRYDAAQSDYEDQRRHIGTAANRFMYTRDEFHQLEDEFLALVEELRRTDAEQFRNLAHLEGMRIRLLSSLDGDYRHAVNELADSLLASLGFQDKSASDRATPA